MATAVPQALSRTSGDVCEEVMLVLLLLLAWGLLLLLSTGEHSHSSHATGMDGNVAGLFHMRPDLLLARCIVAQKVVVNGHSSQEVIENCAPRSPLYLSLSCALWDSKLGNRRRKNKDPHVGNVAGPPRC